MAQRGGSVTSHLRIGGAFSPLIPPGGADLIIAFECAEALRVLPFLVPTGKMLTLDRGLMGIRSYDPAEMTAYLKARLGARVEVVPWEKLAEGFDPRVTNVLLLGLAIRRGLLPFSSGEIAGVLKKRSSSRYLEMNIRALDVKFEYYT
jgi:indolepyruvate ferredoxin oxidoreductase beta subunit